MTRMILHHLPSDKESPLRFNNPFNYTPHPLCKVAVDELMAYVKSMKGEEGEAFRKEIMCGKMFGVLVVERTSYDLGAPTTERYFIAAYSGQVCGRADWQYFVPAVFDYLQPNGFFKTHEAGISQINRDVEALEKSDDRLVLMAGLTALKEEAERKIAAYKADMAEAKARRNALRSGGVGREEEALNETLVRESQFMKAELHRMKKRYAAEISEMELRLERIDSEISRLKELRRQSSDSLQRWLFSHFNMLNSKGESNNLIEIFDERTGRIPPAGAGECCAPRLLQYAFSHDLKPLCMAEFWVGESPKTEIRRAGYYYPACQGKCKPILDYMLQGMDVEPNVLECPDDDCMEVADMEVIYEDEELWVVNKPSGMLSVPGKSGRRSVYSVLKESYPDIEGPFVVHRLDMDTSGMLIVAKTRRAHKHLQEQFRRHEVRKRYVAVLDGMPVSRAERGTVSLPLLPDILDRPRQKVDLLQGKQAVTIYEMMISKDGVMRISLYPETGRTHQLRVHCAHPDGLGCPIKGDTLYGTRADRLYLHAEAITFVHPRTGEQITFERKADF